MMSQIFLTSNSFKTCATHIGNTIVDMKADRKILVHDDEQCKPMMCAINHVKIEEAPNRMSKSRTNLF